MVDHSPNETDASDSPDRDSGGLAAPARHRARRIARSSRSPRTGIRDLRKTRDRGLPLPLRPYRRSGRVWASSIAARWANRRCRDRTRARPDRTSARCCYESKAAAIKLALRAQSQARATCEAIAVIQPARPPLRRTGNSGRRRASRRRSARPSSAAGTCSP